MEKKKRRQKKYGVRRYAPYVTDASRPFQLALDIDGVRTMKEEEKKKAGKKGNVPISGKTSTRERK